MIDMLRPLIPYESRSTDMLQRQLLANRRAARNRNPQNGRKHFAHDRIYRRHFVAEIIVMRDELRRRGVRRLKP